MGVEIERKFLVAGDAWRELATGTPYRQGYLCNEPGLSVRVRIQGTQARLTIKGGRSGIQRSEYEYDLPMSDADELLGQLVRGPLVEKLRYRIPFADHLWEVDEFLGENTGLIIAEVELANVDEAVILPPWVGAEVSEIPRYFNASLSQHPFSQWSATEKSPN